MFFILISSIVIIVGLIMFKMEWGDESPFIFMIIGIVILFLSLLILPLERCDNRSKIFKYEAMKESLAIARDSGDDIEKAAVLNSIIATNQKLASAKYWNESMWFDWYIVDEWANLPPLR